MRKITEQITSAFLAGRTERSGNDATDGRTLSLHGNIIARRSHDGGLEITHAGWPTRTTFDRLNALPGVRIHVSKRVVHLNGRPWDGSWTQV